MNYELWPSPGPLRLPVFRHELMRKGASLTSRRSRATFRQGGQGHLSLWICGTQVICQASPGTPLPHCAVNGPMQQTFPLLQAEVRPAHSCLCLSFTGVTLAPSLKAAAVFLGSPPLQAYPPHLIPSWHLLPREPELTQAMDERAACGWGSDNVRKGHLYQQTLLI